MRKSLTAAAVLIATLAGSPAVATTSDQFDLICKGKEQKRTGVPATAWSERFRIDLDARRWCRGSCTTGAQIAHFTDDHILIYDSRAATGGPGDVELNISRTTGKVTETIAMGWSGSGASIAEGTCERAYFSGFPEQRF